MNKETAQPGHGGRIRSFVLRSGRMTDRQQISYDTLKGGFSVEYKSGHMLSSSACFSNDNPLVVEIGIGMGAATVLIARDHPANNYLGIEVHKPGIGKTLSETERLGLRNLKVIEHDAVEVATDMMADGSIDAFHIFFPDPWPKKRHHKRRLLTRPFTDLLASKLKQGGYLYFVTDWAEYADWALAELASTPGLKNKFECFAPRQEWRPETKFERHGITDGRPISELLFERL